MSETSPKGEPVKKKQRGFCLRTRHKILACLFYILAITLALLYVIPKLFLHGDRYIAFMESFISERIGAEVSVESVNVSLIKGLDVILGDVVVKVDGKPVISAREVNASVYVWESLKGSVKLKKLEAVEPTLRITRFKDGSFNIPFLNSQRDKTEAAQTANTADTAAYILGAFKRVRLTGAKIYWTDEKVSATPFHANMFKTDLDIKKGALFGPATFKFKGEVGDGKHNAGFEIKGEIRPVKSKTSSGPDISLDGQLSLTNMKTAQFWPYIKPIVPFQGLNANIQLTGEFRGSRSEGFSSSGRLSLSSVKLDYKEAYSSGLKEKKIRASYEASFKDGVLSVKKADMNMGPLKAVAKGQISNVWSENPGVEFDLSTNELDLEKLLRYYPDRALTPQQTYFLKENVRWGKITLKNFGFDGDFSRLRDFSNPDTLRSFSGTLKVSGLSIALQNLTYPFDEIEGTISLRNNNITLANVSARYGSSKLDEIRGSVWNIHQWPTFKIHIRAALDLLEARQLIAGRMMSPEFRSQLKQIEWMEGDVLMDVDVSGDTKDILSTIGMNGKMIFNNVGMELASLGLPIFSLNGELEGNTEDLKVKELSWRAGQSSFKLTGRLKDVLKATPTFDLKLFSNVALDDMKRIKFLSLGKEYQQSGHSTLNLGVRGKFTDFSLNYQLDMTDAEYGFSDAFHKPKGLKNTFNFTGEIRSGEKVRISRLETYLGESRVDVTGRIGQFIRGQGIDLTFTSDGVLLDDLDQVLTAFDDIQSGGYIAGSFSIKDGEGDVPVKLAGKIAFENADFKLPIFKGVFRECDGEFDLVNNRLFLTKGKGRLGDGRFRLSGSGIFRKERPEFTLNIDSDTLSLGDFFGKPKDEEKETPTEEETKSAEKKKHHYLDGIWNMHIKSHEGDIGFLSYKNLNTVIRYSDKVFHISPFTFAAHGGKWSWEGDVSLLDHKMIGFDSNVIIQDLDMDRFLEEALGVEKIIHGVVNLRGPVKGKGHNWAEMKRSLEGNLEVSAGTGVIRRFNLLSKIFSLINVTQYFKLKAPDLAAEGMPFNNITARFKINNGVATTDNLMVDSDVMRIMAVGDYNIAENSVLMTVGVMPLVTIDKVISSIPLVGGVLTGKERSLIASYYEVRGKLGDPEVKLVPFESLAAGIVGIFKRLIELPVTTLQKLDKALKPAPKDKTTQEAN